MFDIEIETLSLRLPGKSKGDARAIVEKVGHGLNERLSNATALTSKRIENLRIQLEGGITEKEDELVKRIVDTVAEKIQLK